MIIDAGRITIESHLTHGMAWCTLRECLTGHAWYGHPLQGKIRQAYKDLMTDQGFGSPAGTLSSDT